MGSAECGGGEFGVGERGGEETSAELKEEEEEDFKQETDSGCGGKSKRVNKLRWDLAFLPPSAHP